MTRNSSFLSSKILIIIFLLFSHLANSQECGIVYVTPTGATSGVAGTKANPASLNYGLTLTSSTVNKLKLAEGTYVFNDIFNIPSNITMEGGYNATTWDKSNAYETIFHRLATNLNTNPNRLVALSAINQTNFKLYDITITMDNPTGSGVSTYGIYVSGSSNYVVSRCKIYPGDATDGDPGTPGTPGANGANGGNGESGQEIGDCCKLGGAGGSGSFPGSNPGGTGGFGADRGSFFAYTETILGITTHYATGDYTNDGLPGLPGQGGGGGIFGLGGQGLCFQNYAIASCLTGAVNRGGAGGPGQPGINGFNGQQGVASNAGGWYIPGQGNSGTQGTHGAGGGGGGGGGARGCEPAALNPLTGDTVNFRTGSGGGGGGGGEGGQGGFGGEGGFGGGASFGVYVTNNGQNGYVHDCLIIPGERGEGGQGGQGGAGGQGGQGGAGGNTGAGAVPNTSCHTGEGGVGGVGGTGGNGGNGGRGSDGLQSQVFSANNTFPPIVPNNFNPGEPDVFATYSGCENSKVTLRTNATGNVSWVFGFGASPMIAEGDSITVFFQSVGARGFSLIVDGIPYRFSNFLDIREPFTPPKIQSNKLTVCTGDDIDFATLGSADTYSWTIQGGSINSSSLQNPGNVTFNTVGDYKVYLETTSCCGISVDSVDIKVIDVPVVNLGGDTAICVSDQLPVLNAQNTGANFTWTVNGSTLPITTRTLQTVGNGEYTVHVSFGSCSASDTMNLLVYNDVPVDFNVSGALCPGDPFPVLDANISGMASYNWTFNGNPIGTSSSQTLTTNFVGFYELTATSISGCTGYDSITVFRSNPEVNLRGNKTICSNDPAHLLNAGNPGSTYTWSVNGVVVPDSSQIIFVDSSATYAVDIVNQFGCPASDNMTLTVIPSVVADFTHPAVASVGDPVAFSDNSTPTPAQWTWNFGDNSPNNNAQNPVHVYNEAGMYSVFLISRTGICSDTAVSSLEILNDCNNLNLVADFSANVDTVFIQGQGAAIFTNNSVGGNSFVWNFGDGNTSTLENPVHIYADSGTYNVELTAINYNCTTSVTNSIVVISVNVSDNLTFNEYSVDLYPNPNNGYFTINSQGLVHDNYLLRIFDASGRTVLEENLILNDFFEKQYNLNNLASGLYYIQILNNKEFLYNNKFIINK